MKLKESKREQKTEWRRWTPVDQATVGGPGLTDGVLR